MIPNIAGKNLQLLAHKYKATYRASFEGEQDILGFSEKLTVIIYTALSRKIGQSIMTGIGGADILGLVNQMGAPTQNNASAGKVTTVDLNNLYFAVNRYSRASTKAGF